MAENSHTGDWVSCCAKTLLLVVLGATVNLAHAEQAGADPAVQAYLALARPPVAWADFAKLDGQQQSKLLESAAAGISANDAPAAARNAAQIRQPEWRLAALKGALSRWSESAPAAAVAFMAAADLSDDHKSQVMSAQILAWTRRDAAAAAAWAASLKPCPGATPDTLQVEAMAGIARVLGARVCREDAMRAAAFYWARKDPVAAREWAVRQQPQVLSRALQEMVAQAVQLANNER